MFDLIEALRSPANTYRFQRGSGRVGVVGPVADYLRRLSAGDVEALADYPAAVEAYRRNLDRYLRACCGAGMPVDLLAEGACDWPEALTEPAGGVLDVPAEAPVIGWRTWAIRDMSMLCAPVLSDEWGLDYRKAPEALWWPGRNASSSRRCAQPPSDPARHPRVGCACGIRAVRSRTVLDLFHRLEMRTRTRPGAPPAAFAQVAVWGRVAGFAADDSFWGYTLRAQYARIVGTLHLAPEYEPHRAEIEWRYRLTKGEP